MVSRGEKNENGTVVLFEEIMAENFPELLQCAEALVGENKAKSTNSIGQLDKHMLLRECRECYTDEYGCHGGNLGAPD